METDTITIFDSVAGKSREVVNLKVVHYEEPTSEKDKMISVRRIEFTVIGNNRKWRHSLPYDDFVKANQHVEVGE